MTDAELDDLMTAAHRTLGPAILEARKSGHDALAEKLTRARDSWARAVFEHRCDIGYERKESA